MKTLYESLLDDFEKLADSINPIDEIKQFLKDNYSRSDRFKISKKPNKDGYYEVDCGNYTYVEVKNREIVSLTNGIFEFINVKNFWCLCCNGLTSLKGAPKEVGSNFNCSDCNKLTSLKGAPEQVGRNFNCSHCNNLTSLEGAPKEVGGYFTCYRCKNLTSLEGAPKRVNGFFDCAYCRNLTSLKGAPKEVGGAFGCSKCATTFTKQDVENVCDVKGDIHM